MTAKTLQKAKGKTVSLEENIEQEKGRARMLFSELGVLQDIIEHALRHVDPGMESPLMRSIHPSGHTGLEVIRGNVKGIETYLESISYPYIRELAHNLNGSYFKLMLFFDIVGIRNDSIPKEEIEVMRAEALHIPYGIRQMERAAFSDERTLEFSMADVFADVARYYKAVINPQGKLKLEVKGNPHVDAEQDTFYMILWNMVKNAHEAYLKAESAPEEEKILLRYESRGENPHLIVRDHGPGIPDGYVDTIFDKGVTRNGTSGLGLYFVRETLQRLGGNVEVLTQPGKGTQFTMRLPRSMVVEAPMPEYTPAQQPAPAHSTALLPV